MGQRHGETDRWRRRITAAHRPRSDLTSVHTLLTDALDTIRNPANRLRRTRPAAETTEPRSNREPMPLSDLDCLVAEMRTLERRLAATSKPGDVEMMTATMHAHRCLEAGSRKAQAASGGTPKEPRS